MVGLNVGNADAVLLLVGALVGFAAAGVDTTVGMAVGAAVGAMYCATMTSATLRDCKSVSKASAAWVVYESC